MELEKKIRVCSNNLILNCALSTVILFLNILPYFQPWFNQESSYVKDAAGTDNDRKLLYVSLFRVWVPGKNGSTSEDIKMPMSEFIDYGCPAIDKTVHMCSSYHSY